MSFSETDIHSKLKTALICDDSPSAFFEGLRHSGELEEAFPELFALIGVPQPPEHHTEGDVWDHAMLVIDEAALLRDRTECPFGFMLAALLHDVGKAVTTEVINGRLHAYGHETAGLPIARQFLERLTDDKKLTGYVPELVSAHMRPNVLAQSGASVKSTNKLFDSVSDPEALICLALADGRGTVSVHGYTPTDDFLYERLEIYREYMSRPYVTEEDLRAAGITQNTEILELAHKLRLAGVDKPSALKACIAMSGIKK